MISPALHHGDPVGERHRLGLIVGDVDERDAGATLELLQLPAHALAELGVEVRERLVEEQDAGSTTRLLARATRLLLAAAQLARISLLEPPEVDELEHASDPRRRLRRPTLRTSRPKATFW